MFRMVSWGAAGLAAGVVVRLTRVAPRTASVLWEGSGAIVLFRVLLLLLRGCSAYRSLRVRLGGVFGTRLWLGPEGRAGAQEEL